MCVVGVCGVYLVLVDGKLHSSRTRVLGSSARNISRKPFRKKQHSKFCRYCRKQLAFPGSLQQDNGKNKACGVRNKIGQGSFEYQTGNMHNSKHIFIIPSISCKTKTIFATDRSMYNQLLQSWFLPALKLSRHPWLWYPPIDVFTTSATFVLCKTTYIWLLRFYFKLYKALLI